jgi:hypothetical protein
VGEYDPAKIGGGTTRGTGMDRYARKRLIGRVMTLIESDTLAAVPMDELFAGNADDGSFGRHIQTSRDIPITEYAEVFRSVRARPNAHEV